MIEDLLAKHLDRAIDRTVASILALDIGDSHRFAYAKGTHAGLTEAKRLLDTLMVKDITDEDFHVPHK